MWVVIRSSRNIFTAGCRHLKGSRWLQTSSNSNVRSMQGRLCSEIEFVSRRALHVTTQAHEEWNYNWDKRHRLLGARLRREQARKPETENASPCNRHLLLIQQADYIENTDNNGGLTETGKLQAKLAAQSLVRFTTVFDKTFTHSTDRGAVETAEAIKNQLQSDNLLVNLVPDPMLMDGYPMVADPEEVRMQQDKVYYEDGIRMEAAFRKYCYRTDATQGKSPTEVIITHSNLIRYFVCRTLQLPPEYYSRFDSYPASVTWLVLYHNGTCAVLNFGDISYPKKHIQSC